MPKAVLALLASAALLLVSCGGPVLKDIHSVEELKVLFNEGRGSARIILLLSPT